MAQNFKKKVCLIVDCLDSGGAERMAAKLSIKLSEANYNISIISLRDEIQYEFKGNIYNLGVNEPRIKLIKQIYKFISFKRVYKDLDADVYIDFRMRNRFLMEWLLHKLVFNMRKMIMTIRSYNVFYHIPQSKYFYLEYNRSKYIVGVSLAIRERMLQIYGFKNLTNIPNFYITKNLEERNKEFEHIDSPPFILAIGSLNNKVKQFDKLILIYKDSILLSRNISLFILGEGVDRRNLEKLIIENQLSNHVKLLGFIKDVHFYMKTAKFVVLSSKFEGFPNVLLESLVVGTPVISFDCKSGPSEMIIDGVNGILVEDQNFIAFREAMNKMINDRTFYQNCSTNASNSVLKFSEEKIIRKWIDLIEK